jgi:long-chain acyl-CoA synthetase
MTQVLGQTLDAACQRFDGVALCAEGQSIGYGRLDALAADVATRLSAAGLQADEPVHVMVSNQPLDIAAMLGVWRAGGVVVAVHRSTPPALAAALERRTGTRWRIDLQAQPVDAAALSCVSAQPPPQRALLRDAALIIFTSGSTGEPKGVVIGHDAFLAKLGQIQSLLHFKRDDRVLLVLNLSFGFGLWVSLLTLLHGGTLHMAPRFEPSGFVAVLADGQVTRVGVVPTMLRMLFADAQLGEAIDHVAQLGRLRQILIGGEALGLSLGTQIRQRFAGCELIDIYGLTETSTCDFFAFPADAEAAPGSIGRPAPQVQYRIVDAQGRELQGPQAGELQLRSPTLMAGYLDAPALTEASYEDGWFRTGDLARRRESARVELMGRLKELISRGGNKVTPVEIEQALCSHPDVAAAMAVGVADALLGERIHVLIVPRAGSAVSLPALRQHLASRLERFKQPDAFHLAEALPLGRTGKADRGQFRALIEAGASQPVVD